MFHYIFHTCLQLLFIFYFTATIFHPLHTHRLHSASTKHAFISTECRAMRRLTAINTLSHTHIWAILTPLTLLQKHTLIISHRPVHSLSQRISRKDNEHLTCLPCVRERGVYEQTVWAGSSAVLWPRLQTSRAGQVLLTPAFHKPCLLQPEALSTCLPAKHTYRQTHTNTLCQSHRLRRPLSIKGHTEVWHSWEWNYVRYLNASVLLTADKNKITPRKSLFMADITKSSQQAFKNETIYSICIATISFLIGSTQPQDRREVYSYL